MTDEGLAYGSPDRTTVAPMAHRPRVDWVGDRYVMGWATNQRGVTMLATFDRVGAAITTATEVAGPVADYRVASDGTRLAVAMWEHYDCAMSESCDRVLLRILDLATLAPVSHAIVVGAADPDPRVRVHWDAPFFKVTYSHMGFTNARYTRDGTPMGMMAATTSGGFDALNVGGDARDRLRA